MYPVVDTYTFTLQKVFSMVLYCFNLNQNKPCSEQVVVDTVNNH